MRLFFSCCLYYCSELKSKALAMREEWGERIEDLRRKKMVINSLYT